MELNTKEDLIKIITSLEEKLNALTPKEEEVVEEAVEEDVVEEELDELEQLIKGV